MPRIGMPPRVLGVSLALLLLGAAACAPAAAPSPTAAPAPPAAPAAKPAEKPAPAAPAAKPAEKPAPPAAAAKPKEVFKLEIAMPWILPTEYAPFVMANKRGWYREEGLEVNLNEGTGSGNAVKIVAAGSIPIGLADANRIVAGRVQGLPIKSIMAFYYTSPVLVVSPADKPIKRLADLVGKKLADSPDSANLLIYRAAMKRAGVDIEKVDFVGIDPKAKVGLLLAGQVDAILDQTGNAQMEAEGHRMHKLYISEDAAFEIVADSVFANEEFLKKNPEIAKGFLRASIKGAQYAKDNRDETVNALVQVAPAFTANSLQLRLNLEESWMWTKSTPKEKFGLQIMEGWTNLQDLLFDNKQIDKKIDLKELVDNSYLPY